MELTWTSLVDWLDAQPREVEESEAPYGLITLRKLLNSKRISDQMRLFLIECLTIESDKRKGVNELLTHSWIVSSNENRTEVISKSLTESKCIALSFNEILKSAMDWERSSKLPID